MGRECRVQQLRNGTTSGAPDKDGIQCILGRQVPPRGRQQAGPDSGTQSLSLTSSSPARPSGPLTLLTPSWLESPVPTRLPGPQPGFTHGPPVSKTVLPRRLIFLKNGQKLTKYGFL